MYFIKKERLLMVKLEEQKVLYRNEYFGGGGSKLLKEVFFHEAAELRNTSIIDYMSETLGIKGVNVNVLTDHTDYDDELNELTEIYNKLVKYLQKKSSTITNEWYALWLADKETVLNDYQGFEDLTAYEVKSDEMFVVSNLECSSDTDSIDILIATTKHPRNYEIDS